MDIQIHRKRAGGTAQLKPLTLGCRPVTATWPDQVVVCCNGRQYPVAHLHADSKPPVHWNDPHGYMPNTVQCGQCGSAKQVQVNINA